AEDGIRDFHVTGVQTCALPISRAGGDQQVRQAEAVADLDQLAAADDDLLSCGEGGGGQDERRGVVVDHVDGSGGGHGGGQRGERDRKSVGEGKRGAGGGARRSE